MNRQAVNLINSFNLEFNQQLNELVTMETFPAHIVCTHALASVDARHMCWKRTKNKQKEPENCANIWYLFTYSIDICRYGGDIFEMLCDCLSGWRRRQPKNIVFRMCVYARMHITLLQPSWKLSNEKRISNEYLIEHSALQRVHIQRHEHWTCVCVCAPAIKRISENEYE